MDDCFRKKAMVMCSLHIPRTPGIGNVTWRPTRILLVKAPSGNDAWTRGTVVLLRIPPSGPIWLLSCLIRETTAKYWGKSFVIILQIRFFPSSSGLSSSAKNKEQTMEKAGRLSTSSKCLCDKPTGDWDSPNYANPSGETEQQ